MDNKEYMPKVGDRVIVVSHPDSPTKENGYSTKISFGDIVTITKTGHNIIFIAEEPKFGWNTDWVAPLPKKFKNNKLSNFLNNISSKGE